MLVVKSREPGPREEQCCAHQIAKSVFGVKPNTRIFLYALPFAEVCVDYGNVGSVIEACTVFSEEYTVLCHRIAGFTVFKEILGGDGGCDKGIVVKINKLL